MVPRAAVGMQDARDALFCPDSASSSDWPEGHHELQGSYEGSEGGLSLSEENAWPVPKPLGR
jgi:hypothetical protein